LLDLREAEAYLPPIVEQSSGEQFVNLNDGQMGSTPFGDGSRAWARPTPPQHVKTDRGVAGRVAVSAPSR
jgi:hypothetical protein